ncbi:hypothetical protein GTW69_21870 [Streptomyces sp. SID7760]|nr:hypothetical protein [Streptomyces sp. SID7760]
MALGEGPTVEVDEYVPVTLTWPGYFRMSDSPKSLMLDVGGCFVEIKVDRSSGELLEVIVVDAPRSGLLRSSDPLVIPGFEPGIPCLDVSEEEDWAADAALDRIAPRLHSDGLDLTLRSQEAVRWIGGPRCRMGFSPEDELVRLSISLEPPDTEVAFG